MHASQREQLILSLLIARGFVTFSELDVEVPASPATIRRDLERLGQSGKIVRVRGGARLARTEESITGGGHLSGVPFHENLSRNRAAKEAVGRAAAQLCKNGDSIIIDGGSTTLQMCPYLESFELQVLTNSLHIVSALLPQARTTISLPAGTLFREQNIVLSPFDDDGIGRYRASSMFMGAAAIGPHGLMQSDVILVQAERKLIRLADRLIALVDSSKFDAPIGHVVCDLEEIAVLVTDEGISDAAAQMLERVVQELVVVPLNGVAKAA